MGTESSCQREPPSGPEASSERLEAARPSFERQRSSQNSSEKWGQKNSPSPATGNVSAPFFCQKDWVWTLRLCSVSAVSTIGAAALKLAPQRRGHHAEEEKRPASGGQAEGHDEAPSCRAAHLA